MIEQQAVLWSLSIYEAPTLPVFYVVVLSIQVILWYVHPSYSHLFSIVIYTSFSVFRLARGSILASVIRIMPVGPMRVMALYVSALLIVFCVMTIVQYVWVCQMDLKKTSTGYARFCSTLHIRLTYYDS
jgi:hypothetical protein